MYEMPFIPQNKLNSTCLVKNLTIFSQTLRAELGSTSSTYSITSVLIIVLICNGSEDPVIVSESSFSACNSNVDLTFLFGVKLFGFIFVIKVSLDGDAVLTFPSAFVALFIAVEFPVAKRRIVTAGLTCDALAFNATVAELLCSSSSSIHSLYWRCNSTGNCSGYQASGGICDWVGAVEALEATTKEGVWVVVSVIFFPFVGVVTWFTTSLAFIISGVSLAACTNATNSRIKRNSPGEVSITSVLIIVLICNGSEDPVIVSESSFSACNSNVDLTFLFGVKLFGFIFVIKVSLDGDAVLTFPSAFVALFIAVEFPVAKRRIVTAGLTCDALAFNATVAELLLMRLEVFTAAELQIE
uniref:Uncharacterized protein n=1 Tax=Glossina brevipalpis TaxID=37001 RepID=A0A1A9WE65_9MUSC